MTIIEPDKIVSNKECPFCGWANDPDYDDDHVVNYECKVCGLTTSFIDPRGGFELSELPDGLDDNEFMDAVAEAEKEALSTYGNKQKIPSEEVRKAIAPIFFLYNNKQTHRFMIDIISDDALSFFRKSLSISTNIFIQRIFEELDEYT